jgi:phospholipid/cholesterol/gamma-HCH transport system substrate-binding protein
MDHADRARLVEAAAGLGVVVAAGLFLAHALGTTGGLNAGSGRYELLARFPSVAGVAPGTDVRIAGLKVGTVTGAELDAGSFQAVLRLAIDEGIRLPADSSAAITQEGLLGGSFVALIPGGDSELLRPGDEITDTQGATDLMALVGQVVNQSGGTPPAAPGDTAPGSADRTP